ncbi:hypothetical protein DERP_000677 [Dermatophagoides pteronyssinus]|uniref:Uncharacterized protein n=1 Tax=Dermatophagoides pteronyssinus TaxID=6956 RepID=A0ABQ8J0U2_DERPT|nr:hypothetical protein DERP_000677 [Dermatophagoides pteronyssinus]
MFKTNLPPQLFGLGKPGLIENKRRCGVNSEIDFTVNSFVQSINRLIELKFVCYLKSFRFDVLFECNVSSLGYCCRACCNEYLEPCNEFGAVQSARYGS